MYKKIIAVNKIRFCNEVTVYYYYKTNNTSKVYATNIKQLNDEHLDIKSHIEILISELIFKLEENSSNPIDRTDRITLHHQPKLNDKHLNIKHPSTLTMPTKQNYSCGCQIN